MKNRYYLKSKDYLVPESGTITFRSLKKFLLNSDVVENLLSECDVETVSLKFMDKKGCEGLFHLVGDNIFVKAIIRDSHEEVRNNLYRKSIGKTRFPYDSKMYKNYISITYITNDMYRCLDYSKLCSRFTDALVNSLGEHMGMKFNKHILHITREYVL